MSYSFGVRGATKVEALAMVVAELDKVVLSQPVHAADRDAAHAAAVAFVGMLVVDETRDVIVSVNGSVSSSEAGISSGSVSVSAYNAVKEVAK